MQLIQRRHPGGDLRNAQLIAQQQVLSRHLGLLFQRSHLHLQFFDLVVDAQQVLLGLFELALGLFLAVAEAGDACRLLKDLAPVGALGGDDLGDPALADDGISVPAETGVHQQGVDILEAHGLLVDVVLALPAAVVAAGQHDLRAVGVEDVGGVVDDQADLGIAQGSALLGAAEDHVLHLAAAQSLGALFAHDPENGVGDVGLAGAVRSDDRRDILFKAQARLVRKGLEALNLECL